MSDRRINATVDRFHGPYWAVLSDDSHLRPRRLRLMWLLPQEFVDIEPTNGQPVEMRYVKDGSSSWGHWKAFARGAPAESMRDKLINVLTDLSKATNADEKDIECIADAILKLMEENNET